MTKAHSFVPEEFCQNLVIGHRKDWRLPTKEELSSLLDIYRSDPSLPDGHPFENLKTAFYRYWSSTMYEGDSSRAWVVGMNWGRATDNLKIFDAYIWPVLGGN